MNRELIKLLTRCGPWLRHLTLHIENSLVEHCDVLEHCSKIDHLRLQCSKNGGFKRAVVPNEMRARLVSLRLPSCVKVGVNYCITVFTRQIQEDGSLAELNSLLAETIQLRSRSLCEKDYPHDFGLFCGRVEIPPTIRLLRIEHAYRSYMPLLRLPRAAHTNNVLSKLRSLTLKNTHVHMPDLELCSNLEYLSARAPSSST